METSTKSTLPGNKKTFKIKSGSEKQRVSSKAYTGALGKANPDELEALVKLSPKFLKYIVEG